MGKRRYCRICVNFNKAYSIGGKPGKELFESINYGDFNPFDFVDKSKYESDITNITFIFIKTNESKTKRIVDKIVSCMYVEDTLVNRIFYFPHSIVNGEKIDFKISSDSKFFREELSKININNQSGRERFKYYFYLMIV